MSAIDLLQLLESLPSPASALLQREVSSAYRVLYELNPLEHLFFQASVLDQAWSRLLADAPNPFDFGGLLADLQDERNIQFVGKSARVHSIEDSGVLGAILWMQSQPRLEAVFGNDLAYTRLGLDFVARDLDSNDVLLCEAKGTMQEISGPGRYLRETRRKGRQLSWRWCWQSLTEFAMRGPTARLFLMSFRAVLTGKAKRLLIVSRVNRSGGVLLLDQTTTQAFDESNLASLAGLDVSSDFEKWRKWLAILDSPEGQSRQQRLEIVQTIMAEAYAGMENAVEVIPKVRPS